MADLSTQSRDYELFKKLEDELVKTHPNEYVVISNQEILGYYASYEDALTDTLKRLALGSFIIQKCETNIEKRTQVFHSRVVFR